MSSTVKFRHPGSISIAALVAFFGAIPLGTYRWYLTPLLLVPLAVLVWGIRAGTNAGPAGLTVRALFGSRRLAWPDVEGFAQVKHQVVAVLSSGHTVTLPAVTQRDLPRLVAASGAPLAGTEQVDPNQAGAAQADPEQAGTEQVDPNQAGAATSEDLPAESTGGDSKPAVDIPVAPAGTTRQ